jgi:hypothetical protein
MLGVAVEDFRHDCGEYPCDEASADNDASYDGKFMHALPLGRYFSARAKLKIGLGSRVRASIRTTAAFGRRQTA